MFKEKDLVVYENSGVCRVDGIQEMSFSPREKRNYYVLTPLFFNDGTIYTPVDNPKVSIRPVITKTEALNIIHSLSEKEIENYDGLRTTELEQRYRAASDSNNCGDLIALAMAIYQKSKRARRAGKKVSELDDRYLKRLNTLIEGELSVALEIPQEEVPEFIKKEQN